LIKQFTTVCIQSLLTKKFYYMKRIFKMGTAVLLVMLFTSLRNTVSAQPYGEVTYQDFYDELSPYGRWIDYPGYGYVWCPDTGPDFRPYSSNGHWVWSDEYEWIWVSDYDWGWAPFHYGRWFDDPVYGWLWVPGYEWSPAWVAWRSGGDYYGWAPLMPGINISINFSIGGYAPPVDYWCFAPCRYITSPGIYGYCLPRRQNVTIINHTTIINNYNYSRNVFVTGPRRGDVERYTHERIRPVVFRESGRPGRTQFRNNEINMYRPRVERGDNRDIAPRRFDEYRGGNRQNNTVFRRDNTTNVNHNNNFPGNREENGRPGFGQRGNSDNNGNNGQPGRQFNQRGGNEANDWRNRQNGNSDRSSNTTRNWPVQTNREIFDRNTNGQPQRQIDHSNRQPEINRNRLPQNDRPVINRNSERQVNPGQQERRDPFERRNEPVMNNNRVQRQVSPQMNNRTVAPRQLEQRGNGNRDNGNHGGGRGHRG
jgi:hypothetical protein